MLREPGKLAHCCEPAFESFQEQIMGANLLYLSPTVQISSDLELESTDQDIKIWQAANGDRFFTFFANSRKKSPRQYVQRKGTS